MAKIAQLTSKYISENPVIAECIAKGVVSYSKLARRIGKEIGARSTPAVMMACRRYAEKQVEKETGIDVLRKSKKKIEIKNKNAHLTLVIKERSLPRALSALR